MKTMINVLVVIASLRLRRQLIHDKTSIIYHRFEPKNESVNPNISFLVHVDIKNKPTNIIIYNYHTTVAVIVNYINTTPVSGEF